MKLRDMIQTVCPVEVSGPSDCEILGIAYDSRKVRPGCLFAALPGRVHDGREFIADAVRRGAVAVMCENADAELYDVTYVKVTDSRQALAEVASVFFAEPSSRLQTIGITGTNGKTTVSFLLRDILAADNRSPGVIGTVCYEIGERVIPAVRTTPEAPDLHDLMSEMLKAGCKSVVIEVSSHALVQKRIWGMDFDAVVFTNLTHDHLDYHGSMEDYFKAKSLLFQGLSRQRKDAVSIINTDDPWGKRLAEAEGSSGRILTYGCDADAMIYGEDVRLNGHGSQFNLRSPWGKVKVRVNLMGRFNINNVLAAVATCGSLGVELPLMVDVIAECKCVRGRLEEVPTQKGFRVFVDYAHTGDALKNALQALRELEPRSLIVVFGCGGNRDKSKRPAMGAIAAELADYCILTSDNPRQESPSAIIEQIRSGFRECDNFEVVEDRAEAIACAIGVAQEGDMILIAGKGHECFQEVADRQVPFDDRQQVMKITGVG